MIKLIKPLYKNWWVHNILAHPIMQIMNAFGFAKIGIIVHDSTLPDYRT